MPDAVYQIPPSNPLYNVTYVRVYAAEPDAVYEGYTPGYVGNYIDGPTVVYGTGYNYAGWSGADYYPYPAPTATGPGYDPYLGLWGFDDFACSAATSTAATAAGTGGMGTAGAGSSAPAGTSAAGISARASTAATTTASASASASGGRVRRARAQPVRPRGERGPQRRPERPDVPVGHRPARRAERRLRRRARRRPTSGARPAGPSGASAPTVPRRGPATAAFPRHNRPTDPRRWPTDSVRPSAAPGRDSTGRTPPAASASARRPASPAAAGFTAVAATAAAGTGDRRRSRGETSASGRTPAAPRRGVFTAASHTAGHTMSEPTAIQTRIDGLSAEVERLRRGRATADGQATVAAAEDDGDPAQPGRAGPHAVQAGVCRQRQRAARVGRPGGPARRVAAGIGRTLWLLVAAAVAAAVKFVAEHR